MTKKEIEEQDAEKKETAVRKKKTRQPEASIEEMFSDLEVILNQLETGDISLEDSFELYEKGIKLVKQCSNRLDRVEKKILVLNAEAEEE